MPASAASRRSSTTASPATRSSAARGRCSASRPSPSRGRAGPAARRSACSSSPLPGPTPRSSRRAPGRRRARLSAACVSPCGAGGSQQANVPWEGRCPTAPKPTPTNPGGIAGRRRDRLGADRAIAGVPGADVPAPPLHRGRHDGHLGLFALYLGLATFAVDLMGTTVLGGVPIAWLAAMSRCS